MSHPFGLPVLPLASTNLALACIFHFSQNLKNAKLLSLGQTRENGKEAHSTAKGQLKVATKRLKVVSGIDHLEL